MIRAGGLINDSVMVKLIVGELTSRGWVESRSTLSSGVSFTGALNILSNNTRLAASNCPVSSFLLDGFPRTVQQAQSLDQEVDMNFVVNIDVPRDVILERIANRLVHEPSGRVYNQSWNPPRVAGLDDVTGEKLVKRADDCPVRTPLPEMLLQGADGMQETFARRLKAYDESTAPLLEHYDKAGLLWTVKGNTSDEITPQLNAEVLRRFA